MTEVHIDDPRFGSWEVVGSFEDLHTAKAFRQQLSEQGFDAELTADWPLDRFGRGEIYLSVPPEQLLEAQELVDLPSDD